MIKHLCIILIAAAVTSTAAARDIVGRWGGKLQVSGFQLRLVLRIQSGEGGQLTALFDSPDQGANGIPCDTVAFAFPRLLVTIPTIGARYEATLSGDTLRGTFTQSGQSLPLTLTPAEEEDRAALRPQEPRKPYPYSSEEVRFVNPTDGDTLAGTLTLPTTPGPHPAVALISGSGPQDRDESLMDHKPFLIWADALTRRGIAVLRYDDRGVGASTGDFSAATTTDFSRDAEAALDYLRTRPKDIDPRRIGFIGHSEGGLIAPLVAVRRPDDVGFIVLLSAPGVRGDSLLMMQSDTIMRLTNQPDSIRQATASLNCAVFALLQQDIADEEALRQALADTFRRALSEGIIAGPMPHEQVEPLVAAEVQEVSTPWIRAFVRHAPQPVLRQVKCPVLAVYGGSDVQVPAARNLSAVRQALEAGGNSRVRTILLPGLNHLLQPCQTCLPDEYGSIRITVAPEALEAVGSWIEKQ